MAPDAIKIMLVSSEDPLSGYLELIRLRQLEAQVVDLHEARSKLLQYRLAGVRLPWAHLIDTGESSLGSLQEMVRLDDLSWTMLGTRADLKTLKTRLRSANNVAVKPLFKWEKVVI
jgi:hypothetical protein